MSTRLLLSVTLICAACNSHSLIEPHPVPGQETVQYAENPLRKIDILFMIDNSNSMKEEQASLRASFPRLMQELENLPGPDGKPLLPDLHIGVISSDMGAAGPCQKPGEWPPLGDGGGLLGSMCGLQDGGKFISTSQDPVTRAIKSNFTRDLGDLFGCMADLGVVGCGFEHQLQAVRYALWGATYGSQAQRPEGANAVLPLANAGFLRNDAYLAIIFVTDEDDCSAELGSPLFAGARKDPTDPRGQRTEMESLRCALFGHVWKDQTPDDSLYTKPLAEMRPAEAKGQLIPVAAIAQSIRAMKRPERTLVFGVHGWPSDPQAQYQYGPAPDPQFMGRLDYLPSCPKNNPLGQATAGIRLKAFVDDMVSSGATGASYDLCQGNLLGPIQEIGKRIVGTLRALCLKNPPLDTQQPDCKVTERIRQPDGSVVARVLPECKTGQKPCWQLEPEADCAGSGVKVTITPSTYSPPETERVVKCMTQLPR